MVMAVGDRMLPTSGKCPGYQGRAGMWGLDK